MKKIVLLALLFCAFLFSCNKNEQQASAPQSENSGENGPAEPAGGSGLVNQSYVLRLGGGLWSIREDTGAESDRVVWAESMNLGERVFTGEIRRATYTDGEVYNFIKLRRDSGREGYAFATQIGVGGRLAVVIDDRGNLFSSPRAVDVTGTVLSRRTVVVYYPETESGGFVEIDAFDPVTQGYVRANAKYIRLSSLSRNEPDIQSSILLQTALPLRESVSAEKIRRDALLESAFLDYPASVFHAEIEALLYPNTVGVIQTETVSLFMVVNDSNVNVRDLPDVVAGRIIGTLNDGDEVRISEQTSALSVIDGRSARWYRIVAPVQGWVFGFYLSD